MAERYVTVGGRGGQSGPLRLGRWRWLALAGIVVWLTIVIGLPLAGVILRAFVSRWGEGINPFDTLTLQNFRDLAEHPNLLRQHPQHVSAGDRGSGRLGCGLWADRARDPSLAQPLRCHGRLSRAVAEALPGLVAGLAFLWVFLFVPYLGVLRSSLVGIWLAYSVVWLAFGLRLISASLSQIAPELEEAARIAGAGPARVVRDVTVPLIRFGLVSSWLLCFMIFVREYSTGVYLQGPGTEVLGALIVSLFGGGSLELVAALSVVNVALVAAGLVLALRLGVRM